MSASLVFIQHGFGDAVAAGPVPAVTVFEEAGEPRRGRSVSVKNTGNVRVYVLVNVSEDPILLANQFANLKAIPIEPGDAFTFQPDFEKGFTYKNIAYTTTAPGLGSGSGSGSGSGAGSGSVGGDTTLIIAVY